MSKLPKWIPIDIIKSQINKIKDVRKQVVNQGYKEFWWQKFLNGLYFSILISAVLSLLVAIVFNAFIGILPNIAIVQALKPAFDIISQILLWSSFILVPLFILDKIILLSLKIDKLIVKGIVWAIDKIDYKFWRKNKRDSQVLTWIWKSQNFLNKPFGSKWSTRKQKIFKISLAVGIISIYLFVRLRSSGLF